MDAMSCLESSAFLRRDRMNWGRNETGGNEDGEIAGVGDVLLVGGGNGRLDEEYPVRKGPL